MCCYITVAPKTDKAGGGGGGGWGCSNKNPVLQELVVKEYVKFTQYDQSDAI